MNVTTDNIFDTMKADFLQKQGFPYIGKTADREEVTAIAGYSSDQFVPVKLRAMWLYYLDDPKEKEFGYSIERFTESRVLMKCAARVHKAPSGFTEKLEGFVYICEGWLCWPTTCMRQEKFSAFPPGDAPDVHPVPCYYCNGPMVKVESKRHDELYNAGMVAYKASPDYLPWPVVKVMMKTVLRPMPVPVPVAVAAPEPELAETLDLDEDYDFF
jgi:hypothetical protein